MIPPGSTIGIIGGGQLGRMSALAARRLGYKVSVFTQEPKSVAGMVADREVCASYTDKNALHAFAAQVDIVTFEFENIPATTIEEISQKTPVHPAPDVLHICQNRKREKTFLKEKGFACAPFVIVESAHALAEGIRKIGLPCVLKTADFGYDGKGQLKIDRQPEDYEKLWQSFHAPIGVLEAWIPFQAECSVICARKADRQTVTLPVAENIHRNHILYQSIVPPRISSRIQKKAEEIATAIADALDVVGLIAVEFFVTSDNALIVNELAPRPHNSGHYSFDACISNQFEQHIRAVCDLPLGSTRLLSPVVMVNLLGDRWINGNPDWKHILSDPDVKLDLYDKAEARPGRKMGHYCVFAQNIENAITKADGLAQSLLND